MRTGLDFQGSDFPVCVRAGPASRMSPGFCMNLKKVLCNKQGGKMPPTEVPAMLPVTPVGTLEFFQSH